MVIKRYQIYFGADATLKAFLAPVNNWLDVIFDSNFPFYFVGLLGLTIKI